MIERGSGEAPQRARVRQRAEGGSAYRSKGDVRHRMTLAHELLLDLFRAIAAGREGVSQTGKSKDLED